MRTISHRELRNDSGRVLREVEGGAAFEVTVSRRVVAYLTRATMVRRQRFVDPGGLREIVLATPVDAAAWLADIKARSGDDMDDDPWGSGGV